MNPLHPISLPDFEGPLDLLLQLIEREELDITRIALAQVTEQYMAYLAELEERDVRELTGFLVVAAKLLFIKSCALLPRPAATASTAEQEADPGDELVRQLQAYKRFKEIATLLQEREKQGLHSYVRVAPLPRPDPQLDLGNLTVHDLLAAVQQALEARPAPPLGSVVSPIQVSISGQIARIIEHLGRQERVSFREFIATAASRVEIIITLLAVLELIKQDRVQVRQHEVFGEIIIEPGGAAASAAPAT